MGDKVTNKNNIEKRIKKAEELKASLESKLQKVKGTPREGEFQMQIDKLNDLIKHLESELEQ